jgi:hypothetical protein
MKKTIVYGVSVGAAGGVLLSLAGLVTPVIGLSLGCVYGLIFLLVAGPRANTLAEVFYGVLHSRWCFGWRARPRLDIYLCPPHQGRRSC